MHDQQFQYLAGLGTSVDVITEIDHRFAAIKIARILLNHGVQLFLG